MRTIVFDYETNSLDIINPEVVLVGYQIDDEPIKIGSLTDIKPYLEDNKILKCAHNMSFEFGVSRGSDINIQPPYFCTAVSMWLLGKSANNRYGLKALAKEYLGYEETKTFKEVSKQYAVKEETGKVKKDGTRQIRSRSALASELPREVIEPYCKKDVEMTKKLFDLTYPIIKNDQGLYKTMIIEMKQVPIYDGMRRKGLKIDREYLSKFSQDIDLKIEGLEHELELATTIKRNTI